LDKAAKLTGVRNSDLTTGSVFKKILWFSLPLFVGNIFQQMYSLVDAVIVGQYNGKEALAAVGVSMPVLFLLISFLIGLTMGSATVISQLYGAKKTDELKRAVSTTLIYIFVASIAITGLGLGLARPILELLNTPPEIFESAYTFLMILFGGITLMFAFNTFSGILRGLGDSKTPNYFLIISVVLNIALDFLFVAAFGWGVAGVGWATLISQGIAAALTALYVYKKIPFLRFTRKEFVFDRKIFKVSFNLGLASGVQQLLLGAGMFAIQGLINSYGTVTVAACTAAGRLDNFAITFIMSVGMAAMMFSGQNMGAGRLDRVRKGFWASTIIVVAVSAVISVLIFTLGPQLIGLFLEGQANASVVLQGTQYLHVIAYFYVIMGVMFVTANLLRGCGMAVVPMFGTVIAMVIRIIAAYLMAASPDIGYQAIWWSMPIGWILALVFILPWYFSGVWKKKSVIGRIAGPSAPVPEGPEGLIEELPLT
jgi:putative MATE family efflux protein